MVTFYHQDTPFRLNAFQRTMLHWNDLHPYNAVMVVRIPSVLDVARLGRVINGVVQTHGLSGLILSRNRGTYRYQGGPAACEIKIIPGGEDIHALRCAEIERQLNTPFVQTERFNPFRFFVLSEPEGFSLGVVYFHAIADAEAIVLLVQDLVEAYLKPGALPPLQPLNFHPQCQGGLLSRPWLLLRILPALPALIRNMRSSSRLMHRDLADASNRFTCFHLAPGNLEALLATARTWGVTLNDLFLAVMLKCFSRLKSDRLDHPRRRQISVGCIVNLRKDLGLQDQRVFGPFLSSFIVTHEVAGDITLEELAKNIRSQTSIIKRSRLYMVSTLKLAFARFMYARYDREQQNKMYAKHYPLWGGLTNVNLNSLWKQPAGEKPVDCLSAVSTGPVVPLVFSIMTAGDGLNVAVTWCPAFFSEPDVALIKNDFIEMLAQLKDDHDKNRAG